MEKALFFVIFPEDGVWVAHGLQHNIVTHGECLSEIRENIGLILSAYVRSGTLEQVPKAESTYWERFIQADRAGKDLDAFLDTPLDEETYKLELAAA